MTPRSAKRAERRILIVGPSWVGDMVMAQTLFATLKNELAGCTIDVLAPGWSLPILERMPEVSDAIEMPLGHGVLDIPTRWRLARHLGQRGYDQAILLPNSLKSALIPFFAGIPRRTGWRGEMRYGLLNDLRKLDKTRYPLMIQRFAALAYPEGAPLPESLPHPHLEADPDEAALLRERFELGEDKPVLALCPGAEFGPAKRWPPRHYAVVAGTMIERGWRVALFGSGNDRAAAEEIISELPGAQQRECRNLAGGTRLGEAIDLLSVADAVVSNDSGLMHIAAALDRPLAVVYGSTSPGFTPPLGERVEILSIPVDCGPCFQRECPLAHLKCLNELLPERVLAALDRLLAGT